MIAVCFMRATDLAAQGFQLKMPQTDTEALEEFLAQAGKVLFPGRPLGSKRCVRINSRASDGDTPLHLAACWGNRHAVRLLIEAGARVNAKGDMGNTPLHYAVMGKHPSVAELLLSFGADAGLPSELGFTPRTLAKQSGHSKLVHLFKLNRTAD